METNINPVIPSSVQPPTPVKKSDIIKIVVLVIIAVFFAWVFVQAGMTFNRSYFSIDIG